MKYKLVFNDVGLEDYNDIFETYEEALEAVSQIESDMELGAEILHMSNPGDYPLDEEDTDLDFDIFEIEE